MLEQKLSPMPLVTAILVVIFGGLTLYLQERDFHQDEADRPLCDLRRDLAGGLRFNRLFIKYVFAEAST